MVNISGSLITVTGSLSAGGNVTIDTSNDVFAALRITQRGAGHSLLIEDTTNPDTSPFVIDNVGYVGIGNTTPTSKLSVDAGSSNVVASSIGASISAAEWSGIHFGYTEPTNTYKKSVIAFERLDAAARGTIHILNNNAFSGDNAALADARVSITSAGNVGIGTTVPNFTLAVTGTLGVSGSTTLSTISGTTAQFTALTASAITSSGTITCLSLVETSTRTIKKDIYSMQSQIENIKKLNPVNYVRILDNKQEFGFIAEELKEVYPEFVIGDGVNYPKMVSVLVSAVQELTQKIEKQQDEIELLKNKKKTTRGKK